MTTIDDSGQLYIEERQYTSIRLRMTIYTGATISTNKDDCIYRGDTRLKTTIYTIKDDYIYRGDSI